MDKSFKELMEEETPKKRKLRIKIIERTGDHSFLVGDDETSVDLELEEDDNRNLEVRKEYEFFNVDKESPVKLKMKKTSYAKKLKMDLVNEKKGTEGEAKVLRISDLLQKPEGSTVTETLMVKVFKINEEYKTSRGGRLR